jgi:four helix bundle protein
MTCARFEDLPVWQKAAELYERTEALLARETFQATRGFLDQLDRAALSVSNNIGGTTSELLAFIYIARGSAGEVHSMLELKLRAANKAAWHDNLKSDISSLQTVAESCARQLRGWADALQNSEIKGQRHLNENPGAKPKNKNAPKNAGNTPAPTPARPPASQGGRGTRDPLKISNCKFEISNFSNPPCPTFSRTRSISPRPAATLPGTT